MEYVDALFKARNKKKYKKYKWFRLTYFGHYHLYINRPVRIPEGSSGSWSVDDTKKKCKEPIVIGYMTGNPCGRHFEEILSIN